MFGSGQDKRNLLIAIGAIFVVLVGWQFLMPALFPPDERPRRVAEQTDRAPSPADQAAAGPAPGVEASAEGLGQAGIDSPRVTIDSPRLSGSISRLGGRIDSVTLLDYHETADEESPNIVLLQPRDAVRPYFADFGWLTAAEGIVLPQPDTLWAADSGTLSPGKPVTLRWDNGAGLSFTRKIEIDENFVFTVTQSVLNTTGGPLALTPYSLVARFSDATESILPFKPLFIFQDGALGIFGEDYRDADYEEMRDAFDAGEGYRYEATGGWLGLTDKYWLVALIPDQEVAFKGSFEYVPVDGGNADSFQTIYEAEPLTVNPGQTVSLTSRLFAGAKEISLLDDYEESLGVDRLDLSVDFGPAWFLSKPLFYVIDFFNRATGNFGVAILLLTICVRVLLFPLANKAYASMSRMRKLQPEMIRLRERYKDDKQRANTELMKLYREQKANPVAGCLPLLAQIPVFFALYYMLFVTIEMRHAPFFGWIHDLSAPDPLTFITAFGFLEWPAPEFLLVGIWPLIFGATMWLQMKLNPQPMEPIQQKILMALPIIFLFLFARFPAGLVVYWTWNNVLSIGQQWLIMRRMGITRQSLAEDAEKIKKIKEAAEKGELLKPSRSSRKKTTRSGAAKEGARARGEGTARRDGDARRDGATRARKARPRPSEARPRPSEARRDGGAREDRQARHDGPARRDDAPRRKPAAAQAPGSAQKGRSKDPARKGPARKRTPQADEARDAKRTRSARPTKSRSESATTTAKQAAAERARQARRKAMARKQQRKAAASRRKQPPTADQPTSLMERLKAGLGIPPSEAEMAARRRPAPASEEKPRKSRRQRKAERAAARGTGESDTPADAPPADAAADDAGAQETPPGTPGDGGEWTSQDRPRRRRQRTRKRARRR